MGLDNAFETAAQGEDTNASEQIAGWNSVERFLVAQKHDFSMFAVNFNTILRTGNASTQNVFVQRLDYFFDPQSKDAFAGALTFIEELANSRIKSSREMQDLLKKDKWSRQDLEKWENSLSQIVSKSMDEVPGLGHYRTLGQSVETRVGEGRQGRYAYMIMAYDVTKLNDLSRDIESGRDRTRFDCGPMAVIEGMLNQKLTNKHLPAVPENGNFKVAGSYFYLPGARSVQGTDTEMLGGHYFIYTPAGNVIEATADPSEPDSEASYVRLKPKVTLHDIAAGKPLVGRNDVVYVTDRDLVLSSGGVWDSSKERNFSTVRNARYNAAIEIAGFREDNIQFEQKDLLSRYEGKNHVVLKAPDENFIMVSSRTSINGQAEYELKVYKDVKGDKSLYQIAGYDHAPASQGNATLSAVVEDAEIGKFKFDTNFTGNTVSQDMYEYSALRDFMPASDGYTRIAEQLNKPIFMPAAAVAPSITSKR